MLSVVVRIYSINTTRKNRFRKGQNPFLNLKNPFLTGLETDLEMDFVPF